MNFFMQVSATNQGKGSYHPPKTTGGQYSPNRMENFALHLIIRLCIQTYIVPTINSKKVQFTILESEINIFSWQTSD